MDRTTRTHEELIKLWGNDAKRREFLKAYKEWGVWLTVPELGLTYYRYVLPDGARILAMEHTADSSLEAARYLTLTHYYLWTGTYFTPNFSSESEIIDRLKRLKVDIQKELRGETGV